MALKKFFDGVRLHEVELPDQPLPDVVATNGGDHPFVSAVNPTGVDPALLTIDAAQVPNLRPTDGAVPSRKFPDPLPGNGEGAGVGQPSGVALRDVWANNPARDPGTVETVQSGDIGEALAPHVAQAADVTNSRLQDAWVNGEAPSPVAKPDAVQEALQDRTQVGEVHTPRPVAPVQPQPTTAATAPDFSDTEQFANKDAIREWIKANNGDDPHVSATRPELEAAASELYERNTLV